MDKKIIALTEHLPLPIRVIIESRHSARISLGKKHITLRLPKAMNKAQKDKTIIELLTWAKETIANKQLYKTVDKNVFHPNKILKILDKEYCLILKNIQSNTGTIRISHSNAEITVTVPEKISEDIKAKEEWIHNLLKKGLQKFFLSQIQERVYQLNQQYFQAHYNKVTLRYTTSRWGSCSTHGNISLSSRLLFAPQRSIDYVIIHELAHRFEMNHSSRFWALVEKAMPDYREHEKWLKVNSKSIDF
ncbi:MAG: M48 family metallopeptidase [Chitinophagales bacterium]|nr:M48 family metallopeptidase [Chitinophagales bacterium]